MDRYILSSEDCEILLAIRSTRTLREASRLLDCDAGGLLRKVQRIAADHGVLQKSHGRWLLTSKGLAIVGWTQESILTQRKLLRSETVLRIAATAWFSERILIPASLKISERLGGAQIQYSVPDGDFESALIEGDCDFVIVCHPPENPIVAHKRILPEKWVAVVAKGLVRKHKQLTAEDLLEIPYVRHQDFSPDSLLPPAARPRVQATLVPDNLIGVRAAVLAGCGWSLVPAALVKNEIQSGEMLVADCEIKMDRNICLWWLRHSNQARGKVTVVEDWLRKISAKI